MEVLHRLLCDLTGNTVSGDVRANAGEGLGRIVVLSLYAGGRKWTVPEGVLVTIRYETDDGSKGTYDTLPDGSPAWQISGNDVALALIPQMLGSTGPAKVQVEICQGESCLRTVTFYVEADVSLDGGETGDYVSINNYLPNTPGAVAGEILKAAEVDELGRVVKVATLTVKDFAAPAASQAATAKEAAGAAAKSAETAETNAERAEAAADRAEAAANSGGAVQSVNGQTGEVALTAQDVGAEPSGTAAVKVAAHNDAGDAHQDIRVLLSELSTAMTKDRQTVKKFLDMTDEQYDQLSELVAAIGANKDAVSELTSNKVNKADIVNHLLSDAVDKPLSAAQGAVLKALIDAVAGDMNGQASTLKELIDQAKQRCDENLAAHNDNTGAHPALKALIDAVAGNLANYYTKYETYAKAEIDQRLSSIPKFSILPVTELPDIAEASGTAVYLLRSSDESDNLYTEYIAVNGAWEILGSQRLDLTGCATEQWVQEGFQPKGYYLTEVPEGYAKIEDVPTKPEDIGALPDTYTPPNQTAEQVGADPIGTAESKVSVHNTDTASHNDLRAELKALSDRLTAFFDSDDTTLDELSEIVAYITNNKTLIESITTSKVNVEDIVNNLTTNVANKPLSAAQGVVLKGLIDTLNTNLSKYALDSSVPTKVSQLENDRGYLTEHQDISGKLDADDLPKAIGEALAQAKASGDFDGANGYTPARGTDYWTPTDKQEIKSELIAAIIVQDAGESESLAMSQKAVTDLVNDALGQNATVEYATVDSVEEMTDTTKSYVLSTTGTIWAYGEFTEEKDAENKFVPATATLNTRHATSSTSAANGCFVTDYIAVEKFSVVDPYIMRIFRSAGVGFEASLLATNCRIHYFDANKTLLGNKYLFATAAATTHSSPHTDANGNIYFHIDECPQANGTPTFIEIPDFDHSEVAYVRVTLAMNESSAAITVDDIADVIITFDADAGTVTEYKWYDTGMAPSTGGSGGGGNYVDLLVKVNENKANIAELDSRVIALETDADTLTVPSFWQDAVDACITKIKALQIGRNCITFPFFSDNHQRNGYSGLLIAYIMKECNIPYAFFGGDSIDSGYIASEAVMIAQDKAFDTAMSYIPNGRFCRAVGNHDGYWAVDADNKNFYTDAQNYELFLREESIAQNKHFGGDGTYYYVDDVASSVRFIVLDTNDGTVETEQIEWLQNSALSLPESAWAVVIISHQPISNHYHALISNAAEVREIVTNSGADIIGWFSGHIHRDRICKGVATNTTDDTEGDAMGFTQVTITSDHTGIAYDDATKHPVANDDLSHAIDFVTINRDTRIVNLTRLGIGNDRSYTY